jgi:hypothetical protein
MTNVTESIVLDDKFLKGYGGISQNSLSEVLKLDNGIHDVFNENATTIMKDSHYYDENFYEFIKDKNDGFVILSSNIESLPCKIDELVTFVTDLRRHEFEFSVMCFQECFITDKVDISMLQIEGYNCIVNTSKYHRKGGLVMYISEKFSPKELSVSVNFQEKWETQFIELSSKLLKKKMIIGNVYRLPRYLNSNYTSFTAEFADVLKTFENSQSEIIISGDYNINLLKVNENDSLNNFFNVVTSHSYFPGLTLPTRLSQRSATLIDNFYCRLSDVTINSTFGILIKKFSDHQPYFMYLDDITTKSKTPAYIPVSCHKPCSMNDFITDLNSANVCNKLQNDINTNPNMNYNILEEILSKLYDKHFPIKMKKYHKHKYKGNKWVTSGIIISIKRRDQLYKHLKMTDRDSPEFDMKKQELANTNRLLKQCIRSAKSSYYTSQFTKHKSDMKNTWKTITEILNKNKKLCNFPEYFKYNGKTIHEKLNIANMFNDFFVNVGPKLAHEIPQIPTLNHSNYLTSTITHTIKFDILQESDILKIIDKLKPKTSSGYDNISTHFLKQIKHAIVKPLTIIINQCFKTGIFPDKLKIAEVIPLFKKGDNTVCNNYRPISLLPSISKVFEKAIFIQTYEYFLKNKLFIPSQYGFRTHHSTELAAIDLIENVIVDIENDNIPLSIFLDLSKAFDTLNHEILYNKLRYYGFQNTELELFKSYLTNRYQYVKYDNSKSDLLPITTGVPQGSILGPLLFIIYINDMPNASDAFKFTMYADDTTLLTRLNIGLPNNTDIINAEIKQITNWLSVNKLSLNVSKSKYMVFNTKRRVFNKPNIVIHNSEIECVDQFNFLGIIIDNDLSWKGHVAKVNSKLRCVSGVLNRLKHTVYADVLRVLYNSLALPHINYGILTWGSKQHMIFKMQKKLMRIITNSKYNAHTEPLFKRLKLLKVADIYTISKYKLYHKHINNELPLNLLNINFVTSADIHNYDTRAQNNFVIPRLKYKVSEQSLRFTIPTIVNTSPCLVREKLYTHSLHGMTSYVKQFLLNTYFEICVLPNCYICNSNR